MGLWNSYSPVAQLGIGREEPRMSKTMIALALGCTVVLVGCRTVWKHPDASAEMYREDRVRCQFGMTPAELDRLYERYTEDPASQMPRARRGWKQCMVARGWTTSVGSRARKPWSQPWP